MFNNKKTDLSDLSDLFNKKKTHENEMRKFNNIHQNLYNKVHWQLKNKNFFVSQKEIKEEKEEKDTPVTTSNKNNYVYKLHNIQTSTKIDFNLNNANYNNRNFPIVPLKEISVPRYLETDFFDVKDIYKSIDKFNDPDILNEEDFFNVNIEKLHKKNIKCIINVYQDIYLNNIKPTGLGDFIRGCYFLLQFCEKYNFKFKLIINHPIAFYLEKFYRTFLINKNLNMNLFSKIPIFSKNNWEQSKFDSSNFIISAVTNISFLGEFVNFLYDINKQSGNLFIYNTMFPYDNVKEEHKGFVRNFFEPNQEMKLYVDDVLTSIGLLKNNYSVIHIRSGDKYLTNDDKLFQTKYFNKLIYDISRLVFKGGNFLLIADNNEIKLLINEKLPSVKTFFKNITHLGEGHVLEKERVKNTMLDFYLFSYSNSIHAFSCYQHGSGFSYWCAQTYNIPYQCKYIATDF